MTSIRVAVFSSGRGSNFDAILARKEQLGLQMTGLICDQEKAPVLEKAKKLNIPTLLTNDPQKIISYLQETKTEWIILAGYMRILPESIIEAMRSETGHSKIINIHPSLLPAFPGLRGYRQAYEYGCKVTGVTIHLVEKELDQGPILAQESFSIEKLNSVSEVEAVGLTVEHRLYSQTLAWVLQKKFQIENVSGRSYVRPL